MTDEDRDSLPPVPMTMDQRIEEELTDEAHAESLMRSVQQVMHLTTGESFESIRYRTAHVLHGWCRRMLTVVMRQALEEFKYPEECKNG